MSFHSPTYGGIPNTGEMWPTIKAFKIAYKNADGETTLSSVIQGPWMTADEAMASSLVTHFMRENFIAIYSCQPLP